MKIFEVLELDHDVDGVASIIQESCQEYLHSVKQANKWLFRGFTHQLQQYHLNLMPKRNYRLVDDWAWIEIAIDDWLRKIDIKTLRKDSFFATTDKQQAFAFGNVYYCFPVDGFTFAYSPDISDVYPLTEDWLQYYALDVLEGMGRQDSKLYHMLDDARNDLRIFDIYLEQSKALRQFYGMAFLRQFHFYQDDLAKALLTIINKHRPEIWINGTYHLVRANAFGDSVVQHILRNL